LEIGRYKLVLKEEEDKNRKLEQHNKDINMWADDVQHRLEQLIKDYSRRDAELSEALSELTRTKETLAETVAQLRALQKRIDDWNVPEYSEIGVAPPARRPLPGQLRM
jgi:DNA repair exonuclease SbcCD ATPase subunit